MGQYCLLNYLGQYDESSSKVMVVVRKIVNAVCGVKQKFWVSKLLDTKFVNVDEEIMKCVIQKVAQYQSRSANRSTTLRPMLHPLLRKLFQSNSFVIESTIFHLHIYTEVHLNSYDPTTTSMDSVRRVHLCRKISNYMVYLLAMRPEMMPVLRPDDLTLSLEEDLAAAVDKLTIHPDEFDPSLRRSRIDKLAVGWLSRNYNLEIPEVCTEDELLELQEAWVGLLIYVASKSPPEMHAAQLATGGELLTFIWLLMAHGHLGESMNHPFKIISRPNNFTPKPHYIFHLPPQDQS